MRCKAKRVMKSTKDVVTSNGRSATKGQCTKCDTNMYKINGKANGVAPSKSKSKSKKKSKKGGKRRSKRTSKKSSKKRVTRKRRSRKSRAA